MQKARQKPRLSRKEQKKTRLSKECIEKNLDTIIAVAEKEGVVVDPLTICRTKTVYECPYKGCSMEYTAANLLQHLTTHKSQTSCVTKCPFCEKCMNNFRLISHLENGHPELNSDKVLKQLNSSIDPAHKAIRETIKIASTKRHSVAARMSDVLQSSIFTPSPSNMSFVEFRTSLRRKLFEDVKVNSYLIFKFLARANALEWGCLICSDNIGLTFKNPISLRLNALFHLEKHVNEEHFEHLQEMITKEWGVLMKEVPPLPITAMRTCGELPIGRSFLSYCLLREDDRVAEAMDAIDRCYLNDKAKKMRNALCLLCQSPFIVSLSQPLFTPHHFQVDSHQHLKAKGWSEFTEVAEIAEVCHGETSDVHASLLFSSFLHLTNEQDASPKNLFKWRCALCSLDVAVFPSSASLRFFALRHLEKEHPRILNDHFYRHEWSLLQVETSLVSMRAFSQNEHIRRQGRPLDITDPSDFIFPWQRALRVPSPDYYTCGHCFFVSTETEIRDHLAGHGFVAGDSSRRMVIDDGGQEAVINERTIRGIRKSLSVPSSILYDESASADHYDLTGEGERQWPPMDPLSTTMTPSTSQAMSTPTSLMDTPKSSAKYALRVRSSAARYVPIEEEETNNDTMSSEESDSGLEKNYHTMSGDDTMEETMDEGEMEEEMQEIMDERPQSSLSRRGSNSSERRKKTMTVTTKKKNGANTCTESSVAFDDLYDLFDTGIVAPLDRREGEEGGEGTTMRKRETERVHEKAFKWEGDDPPQLTAEQVELIREFKSGGRCTICPRGRGYRGVGKMTNVEQSMMAHHIVNHSDNQDAMAIVTRKRFLLASSLAAGKVETMPPFLLQSVHPHHLTCSRCMEFKCAKQSNLVVHWEACTGVKGNRWKTVNRRRVEKDDEEEEEGQEKGEEEQRRKTVSVRCSLCREGWRKSVHYSDDVSVAIHLLLKHTQDKEAYAMAMQLEEETNLQSAFPWIHLTDSFALRVDQPDSGIQCSLCHVNSPTLASAIRHATRAHATAKEKAEANFAAGALSCPLPSSSSSSCTFLRSVLLGRPRSVIAVHFLHVLFNHDRKEKEARRFMKRITQGDKDKLCAESNLRLNVDESVKHWFSGRSRLVCSLCSQCSCQWPRHMAHFADHECGTTEDRLKKRRSTAAKMTPMSRLVSAVEAMSTPTTLLKRGRGRAPDAAMKCAHCPREIYASAVYASSISMDLHLLDTHPKEKTITPSSAFPFIDFSLSSSDRLQCALCMYTAKESRYVVDHAWTKHSDESKAAQGVAAWAEFELAMQRKRAKQRVSCSRPMKRARRNMKEGGGEEREEGGGRGGGDETDEGIEQKRQRLEEETGVATPPHTATALIRTPRQRSTVSRWLDTSIAGVSTYSPSTTVDEDLRYRLDRLFTSGVDSPSSSQQQHASSSIFKELPETSMTLLTPKSSARDISHIKGLEGVRCSVCDFKGRDTESLRIHFNEAHQGVSFLSAPAIFPCAACSLVFNSKKKWRAHCEEDHAPKDRPFQCFKCEYRYETHQKMRAHQIRVHESEILVHPDDRTCLKCNKLFGTMRAFQTHKKRHEERDDE